MNAAQVLSRFQATGTGWLWRVLERIEHGRGRPGDIDLLEAVAGNIQGRTICALGDSAAVPVRSMLRHFRHDFEAKIEGARSGLAPAPSEPAR